MTEPDEALIWARDDLAGEFDVYKPYYAALIRRGREDASLSASARAYRAGQAASAERIKALKKLVQNLMLEVRARTMRSNTPLTTNIVEMTVPDRVALLKEADQ